MTSAGSGHVLLVTSDRQTARVVLEALAARGVPARTVADARRVEDALREKAGWSLLLADGISLDGSAFEVLKLARRLRPEMPVVLLAPGADARTVVHAMQAGCDDVGTSALDGRSLDGLIQRHLVTFAGTAEPEHGLIGTSAALLSVVEMARRVAQTSAPVLLCGESGTGKELLSQLLHRASRRSDGPFIRVNCAALSESLLESELFGHEKGAFTGAGARREGRFERADGGTLLLDEISETTPRLQAELLRVLEQQDFERVGGSENVRVNVRVLSTTNRDLLGEVQKGTFRRDLYYRLSGVRLELPPLRLRTEDIPQLVWHFIRRHAPEARREIRQLDAEMMEFFCRCPWPGNVRQLGNVVRSAVILGSGPVLSLCEVPHLRAELEQAGSVETASTGIDTLHLRDVERQAILEALRRTRSCQAKAARLLGITDRTLREKLRRYRTEGQAAPLEEIGA